MKRTYLLLAVALLILLTPLVSADFLSYNHNAVFNETADCAGALCNSWGTGSRNTDWAANGTASFNFGTTASNADTGITTTGTNMNYSYVINITSPTDYFYTGIRNDSGNSFSDGKGIMIGSPDSGAVWKVLSGGSWGSGHGTITAGTHSLEIRLYNGNDFSIYVDGLNIENGTTATTGRYFSARQQTAGNSLIDDLHAWNETITPPVTYPYANIQVTDLYDNSTLEGLTVYEGTLSNVTTASGIAYFYSNDGLNFSVDGGSLYFNTTGTAVQNATFLTSIYGAFPLISAYNVEGTAVTSFNLTSPYTSNTTSTGSARLLLPPNTTTTVNLTASGYEHVSASVNTTGHDLSSKNITDLYQTAILINATNAYTGARLTNFTGWVYNNETGYNVSFDDSGTGNATVLGIHGLHTIFIDVDGYSIGTDNYDQSNYTSTSYNKTFAIYSNNSILITIRNEETNTIITQNVTVTVSGNASEDTYYTTTGELFLENLTDGNYTLKFEATNFTLRTYEVTVADRSTQELTAYLSPGTDVVTFAIIDFDTSQAIEGASIIQQRLINSTWTTVESKSSDITGRAQFTYTIGVKYRFTVTQTGYTSKVFELDPVIFTSYFIRLEKDLVVDSNTGYFDFTVTYYPTSFTNAVNNTFTITFGSVGGSLESYGYTLAYPGGSFSGGGTNANGGTFTNTSFLISGATFLDTVNLTYWYDSVYGDNKTYAFQYVVEGAANTGTLADLKNDDKGLGTVEKILIAVLSTLVIAGVLTLYGAPILGVVGGLFSLGYFVFIGFLSIWVAIPSLFVGFLILARRSSE